MNTNFNLIVFLKVGVLLVAASQAMTEEPWQNCDIFLAPSSVPGGGWGVYAGRTFQKGEIVEVSPRHIAIHYGAPVVLNSVLNDYIYGQHRWDEHLGEDVYYADIAFGKGSFYNHHSEPNTFWTAFGSEPTREQPTLGRTTGVTAMRRIEAGEELFVTYDKEGGGKNWFSCRKLEMMEVPTYVSRKNGTVFEEDRSSFCSKVYAGYGLPGWRDRILDQPLHSTGFPFDSQAKRMAPIDHPTAVVNQDVAAGTILEMGPALIVSKEKVANTALAPLSFFWQDLDGEQHRALMDLRDSGDLRVQHQDDENHWVREDRFRGFEDIVLIPVGGSIGLVVRVHEKEDANCMIRIVSSGSMKSHMNHGGGNGSTGIMLQLVSTKDLATGDELKLDIPVSASNEELKMLAEELRISGQLIPDHLQPYVHDSMHTDEL